MYMKWKNSSCQSVLAKKGSTRVKWWDSDDEVSHTCSPQQSIITTKTVIKIWDLLIMISLNELFRGLLAQSHWSCMSVWWKLHFESCFYLPHSDSIQRDSLCPWIQLEWFHQTPGKKFRETNMTEANLGGGHSTVLFCSTSQSDKASADR